MSYKIIVARYNENIEWLKNEMENVVVFNKGEPLCIDNEIIVENKGRESETYIRYIIDHYDNLPDILVFTQARISDHFPGADINYLIELKDQALLHSKSQNFFVHTDVGTNRYFDKEWNISEYGYYLTDNYLHNKHISFYDWFVEHINSTYPNPICVYGAAVFSVKKENVLRNPIEYYKKLINLVNHHSNPIEAHFFERSWYYIF